MPAPHLVLLPLALAATASAHDFWIEPSAWRPAAGDRVNVRLLIGDHFRGEPFPRDPTHMERFVHIADAAERPVVGIDGKDPAGILRITAAGPQWIVYRSQHRTIELDPEKFESYLAEEGLDRIVRERARRGEADLPGREVYSRCAKALIMVGDSGGEVHRAVGLTLELIPERIPAAGEELPVRLEFRGQPLDNAQVAAYHGSSRKALRTGPDGRVRFPIDAPGPWLIKSVHMERTEGGGEADWESWWASLTFSVSPGPSR